MLEPMVEALRNELNRVLEIESQNIEFELMYGCRCCGKKLIELSEDGEDDQITDMTVVMMPALKLIVVCMDCYPHVAEVRKTELSKVSIEDFCQMVLERKQS